MKRSLALFLVLLILVGTAAAETDAAVDAERILTEAVPAMHMTHWQWFNDTQSANLIAGLMVWYGWNVDFEDKGVTFSEAFDAGGKECYLLCYDSPSGTGFLDLLIDCHEYMISISLDPLGGNVSYGIHEMNGIDIEDLIAYTESSVIREGFEIDHKKLNVYDILHALEQLME